MANRELERAKEEAVYACHKLPENIRQIGEQPEKERIYMEDYVMTFLRQRFAKKQEDSVSILIGKQGTGEAEHVTFVYGAVCTQVDIGQGADDFGSEKWDKIHEAIHNYFSGAQVLGWACTVSLLNSQIDANLKKIHKRYFSQDGKLFFLYEAGEREEKLYAWKQNMLQPVSGYTIYFDKNPLMQEYMLSQNSGKSMEAAYEDKVTANVRTVIRKNEERKGLKKYAMYSGAMLLLSLALLGINMLKRSNQTIDSLQKTIETLSDATTSEPEQSAGSSEKAGQTSEAASGADDTETEENQTEGDQAEAAQTEAAQTEAGQTNDGDETDRDIKTDKGDTDSNTKSSTESNTGSDTKSNTESSTESDTKSNTESSTESNTKSNTESSTESSTESDTKSNTESSTESNTKSNTESSTKSSRKEEKSAAASAVKRTQQSYVVRKGDTLSQIVWRQYHNMKYLKKVKKVNNIQDSDKIQEGQRLILPACTD